jgi:hypothetical protein
MPSKRTNLNKLTQQSHPLTPSDKKLKKTGHQPLVWPRAPIMMKNTVWQLDSKWHAEQDGLFYRITCDTRRWKRPTAGRLLRRSRAG